MKIKVEDKILDYEGKEVLKDDKTAFTVRDAISIALNGQLRDENITAEQKNKIFQISIKIWSNKEVDLTVDDRAFIKERAGKLLSALVYGRLSEILEEKK
jgi:ABC-type phosphate transport system substrate-binding protein